MYKATSEQTLLLNRKCRVTHNRNFSIVPDEQPSNRLVFVIGIAGLVIFLLVVGQ
ncbi:hypothetical protein [Bacteriophage sp.]|nr:hypothetical protein [Bacteriophage sp.]